MMVSNALPKPPPGIIKCPSCGKPLVYKKFKNPFGGPDYEFPCLDCDCKNREDSFKKVEARAKAAGIPKKFRHEDLSDWKVIPGTERLYSAGTTYAKNLKKNIAEGIGCIFVSKGFGTGKSKMVHYIQVEAIKAGIQTYSITSKSLMGKIRRYKERRQYAESDDLIRRLLEVPFLIYDDLGEQKPAQWDRADVESVITERETFNRATLFTSNKDEDQLNDHFGGHITSRVFRMAVPYIVYVESTIDMRRPENRKTYGLPIK